MACWRASCCWGVIEAMELIMLDMLGPIREWAAARGAEEEGDLAVLACC